MNPRTPHGQAMHQTLTDGLWHPLEEVIQAGIRAVPPGQATRAREAKRQANLATGTGAGTPRPPADPATIGARLLTYNLINSWKTRGAIQRAGDQIRLTPAKSVG